MKLSFIKERINKAIELWCKKHLTHFVKVEVRNIPAYMFVTAFDEYFVRDSIIGPRHWNFHWEQKSREGYFTPETTMYYEVWAMKINTPAFKRRGYEIKK